ncbi:MAG: hypothetical protein J0M08_08525 [Bacteroidetes bacterium]|nr:hypothetical protein [Bacteroidota bacterium]
MFLKKSREYIGKFLLQSEAKKNSRNRRAFNLEDAKTIGILFDSSNKEDFDLLKKYITYLKEMKKKVKAIGYYSSGFVPQFTYSKLEYDFFTPKELNLYCKPTEAFVKNFIEEEYDILIDLNMRAELPLQFIGAASKAQFKVGIHNDFNEKNYDFLIKVDTDKSVKFFLRQIDTYLFMINNRTNQPL